MITTERLQIRRFMPSDYADFMEYQGHPEVVKYMIRGAMDEAKARAFLDRQATLQHGDRDVYHAWALVLIGKSKMIGDVGFYRSSETEHSADLGYQLHPNYQGEGLATEAANALIDFVFETWGLEQITAGCNRENVRSYRLMERVGMTRAAPTADPNAVSYLLSREEWLKGRPSAVGIDEKG